MRTFKRIIGVIVITGVFVVGCDSLTDSVSDENKSLQSSEGITSNLSLSQCHDTGVGLTANYINESPNGSFDVNCDIGIYFNEDGNIRGATLNGTVDGAKSVQYGIYIDGADVKITNTSVSVVGDYPHQFISVAYINGASGTLSKSELSGAHRVGLLVRGGDTNVKVRGNKIIGTGAKTSGWAENGVQVDQGAVVNFTNNDVADHWWDGESNWASTGVMLNGADNSSVTNNTFTDNEFSAFVIGDDNSFKSNKTSSDVVSESSFDFVAWGVLLLGANNDITGNRLTATDGGAGIYIYPGSEGNKLTGNRISGFASPIVDGGVDTKDRGNPSVFN
tara:strand:- start:5663 stop:6664 length:1002 start_codon:yes stop_codon:yes gene_type:complete